MQILPAPPQAAKSQLQQNSTLARRAEAEAVHMQTRKPSFI